MKQYLLAIAALFTSVALFAQAKGEKYIALSGGASFGNGLVESYDGSKVTNSSNPLDTKFFIMGELGYFVAKNFRLALGVGVPYTSTPTTKSGNTWLYSKVIAFQINPNIAYYVRLADRFYYTPEVGFSYNIGNYLEEMIAGSAMTLKLRGWTVYTNLFALEYRVSPKVAISTSIGTISYSKNKYTAKGTTAYIKEGLFNYGFNDATVSVRFYF